MEHATTRFEWDPEKERLNIAKHGISFEHAALVFADPQSISEADEYIGHESRWRTIGLLGGALIAVVVHLRWEEDYNQDAQEVIRIISARRAERREIRHYANKLGPL